MRYLFLYFIIFNLLCYINNWKISKFETVRINYSITQQHLSISRTAARPMNYFIFELLQSKHLEIDLSVTVSYSYKKINKKKNQKQNQNKNKKSFDKITWPDVYEIDSSDPIIWQLSEALWIKLSWLVYSQVDIVIISSAVTLSCHDMAEHILIWN